MCLAWWSLQLCPIDPLALSPSSRSPVLNSTTTLFIIPLLSSPVILKWTNFSSFFLRRLTVLCIVCVESDLMITRPLFQIEEFVGAVSGERQAHNTKGLRESRDPSGPRSSFISVSIVFGGHKFVLYHCDDNMTTCLKSLSIIEENQLRKPLSIITWSPGPIGSGIL